MGEQENKVAARLRVLRAEAGVTQAETAKNLGISQQKYSNLEKGLSKPDMEMISKICDYYGITSDYLLGRESPPGGASTSSQSMTVEQRYIIDKIAEELYSKLKNNKG